MTQHANWMGDLLAQYPAFGDVPVNNLLIPGTHDSGTFNTGKATQSDHTARTQSLDIKGQLERGIRYFDLRVQERSGTYYIQHGPWKSDNDLGTTSDDPDTAPQKYLFKQMRDFLKAHPHEILILKFQNFESFSQDEDYHALVNLMEKYFSFPGCGLVKLPEGTTEYINQETLNTLIKKNMRVFAFWDLEDVPNERKIWDHVFQYSPVLEKGRYGLWDPYWHDYSKSLADDNVDLAQSEGWWEWHSGNLNTWNSDGFFVLQSHMQQLPGKISDAYFNIAEQAAAANYYMNRDAHGHLICNNERNIKKYIEWFNTGQQLNIVTFDFVQHGDVCGEIVRNYHRYYQRQTAASGGITLPE